MLINFYHTKYHSYIYIYLPLRLSKLFSRKPNRIIIAMKHITLFLISFLLLTAIFSLSSCFKTDDDGGWSDDEKASYENVISLQDEVANDLDEWFITMDSLDAIEKAQQTFANAPEVSSATINSQGIAVQYANGMRGGLYLNPKDDKGEVGPLTSCEPKNGNSNNFKSLVNNRKMILINPHYSDRSYYTDQIYSNDRTNLSKVGMELSTFYKDQEATVDRFTELSGYGIIQIYSHGWAWPKEENITNVYLLTGETANEATSKKYWDDLKTGNIPVMKMAGSQNHYLVSPEFISNHNDFSKDTILFLGGFCYSFLGNWPDIINDFADGAYVGYDWSVYTFRNANWAVNQLYSLSDTTADKPVTLNDWFHDGDLPKSYWNARDNRTVNIQYTGDGNLTLWSDVNVRLIALSDDGTPVSNPGEAGVAYPFKCEVVSNISDLEYIWNIGDGSEPVSASNEVNITWSEDGQYLLKVDVKDKSNGNLVGSATANVTIGTGSSEVVQVLQSCKQITIWFGPDNAFQFSPAVSTSDADYATWSVYGNLVWNGLNFTGTYYRRGSENYNIAGSVSADGQKVSITATADVKNPITFDSYYKIVIADLPLHSYETSYPNATYSFNQSPDNYVTTFEGTKTIGGVTGSVTGVSWGSINKLEVYFEKEFK